MNSAERKIANKLTAEGWSVVKGGWPDFICVRAGIVKAVEVKSSNGVQPHQRKTHDLLKAGGIEVEVVPVPNNNCRKTAGTPLTASLWKRLNRSAIAENRTVSQMLRILLEEALHARANGHRETA